MAIADTEVPAITPLNAAAPEFIINTVSAAASGCIRATWTTNYKDNADFVYMAALAEADLTYYNGLAKPAPRVAGDTAEITISGLTPSDPYTVVLAGYDAGLDLWSSPVGEKNVLAGA